MMPGRMRGTDMQTETVAQRFTRLREAAGLSLDDLAASTGISKATLSAWGTGRRNPDETVRRLLRLCDELGVSLGYFLNGLDLGGDQ